MLIAVLSDAHGNKYALCKCLEFFRRKKVSRYIFLGDAIGYFPYGEEVCSQLMRLGPIFVQGNHEAIFSGSLGASSAQSDVIRLPEKNSPFVRIWARRCSAVGPRLSLLVDGKHFLLVHGSPRDPYHGRVRHPEEVGSQPFDCVLLGHTHQPFVGHAPDGTLVLNPGSCGYPRDDGRFLSAGLLDTKSMAGEIFRIPFAYGEGLLGGVHPEVRRAIARRSKVFGTLVTP